MMTCLLYDFPWLIFDGGWHFANNGEYIYFFYMVHAMGINLFWVKMVDRSLVDMV